MNKHCCKMSSWQESAEWMERSVKHKAKFQKLRQLPPEKVTNIGVFKACFDEEFVIGTGSDGTCVFIGLSDDGSEVAVKRILSHACASLAENEKNILNMMKMEQSKHIVRYRYFKRSDPFSYLILELCEETLEDYVNSHSLEELQRRGPVIIREILTGLLTLHDDSRQDKILHRDLKPANILVDVEETMRLSDFGISRKLRKGKSTHHTGDRHTGSWRALECLRDESRPDAPVRYKRKSDVQVAGMLCYYVLTKGGHPFGGRHDRERNLRDGNLVGLDKLNPVPVAKDLVSWMLKSNLDYRPYVHEALKHPYLQSCVNQFELLVCLGNEPEIKTRDLTCDVVRQLNNTDPSLPVHGWKSLIEPVVLNHMIGQRRYNDDIVDLLRFIRNTQQHWRDPTTPGNIQLIIHNPARYFIERFPTLPMVVHKILRVHLEWKERTKLKTFLA